MSVEVGTSKAGLRKGLNFFSSTLLGFNTVAILVDVIVVFGQGLVTGGPAVMVWGFIAAFVMTLIVATCLAEISGAFPVGGSVYNWSAQVVPSQHGALASYSAGWIHFFGVVATKSVLAATFSQMVNAAIVITSGHSYPPYEQVALAIGTLFFWSILNISRIEEMALMSYLIAFLNFGTTIVVVVAVLVLPYRLNPADKVFFEYHNETGYNSVSYVTAIGLLVPAYCFLEYDGAAKLAEETENAEMNAPRGILSTVMLTGIGGLGLFIAFLFATVDIDAVLDGRTDFAIINLLDIYLDSTWAVTLAWLLVANVFFAGVSGLGVTARMALALAQDGALPFSSFFAIIDPTFHSPINAVMFTSLSSASLLLLLLSPESSVAFFSLIGLAVIGTQISYAIPLTLKLIFQPANFPKTSWSLGFMSIPLGIVSIIWLWSTSIIGFLPTVSPITATNMNYASVVAVAYILVAVINWMVNSRHTFKGPQRHDAGASRGHVFTKSIEEGSTVGGAGTTISRLSLDQKKLRGHSYVKK